jgi:hypothetical protein
MSVEALIELRNRTFDALIDGQIGEDMSRADLNAIAIEIDGSCRPTDRTTSTSVRLGSSARSWPTATLVRRPSRPRRPHASSSGVAVGTNASGLRNRRPMEPVFDGTRNSRRWSPTKSAWRGPCSRPSETREPSKAHPSDCVRWPTARSRHRLLESCRRFLT